MKVKLADIFLDEDIYPRRNISHKTVEGYVEALKGGAVFPPIDVQRLRYSSGEERTVCLDGKHRITAIEEFNKQAGDSAVYEVEANFWKGNVLDRDESLEDLRIRCATLNLIHGDRLSSGDLANVVLKIVRGRPIDRLNGVISELARKFGYHPSTISILETEEGKVSDVLAKRRLSRDFQIYRLLQLGWTQEEVGGVFGLKKSRVYEISTDMNMHVSGIQNQHANGKKSAEELAKFNNMDIITTWAMILQGKDDLERFSLFGTSEYQDDAPRLYNVWNFAKRDTRLGEEYPGNIPGQIAMNILYYYTEQGGLVVDPMAGGGSTVDACLVMGRKCRAYDINPMRKDVVKWDLSDGFPPEARGCNLIFLDPPYWNLLKGLYTERSISEASLDEWLSFMEKVIKESYGTVRRGGHIALMIEAMADNEGTREFHDLPYTCMKFLEDVGFKEVQRMSVPLSTQVKSHRDVGFAKKRRITLSVNRDLIVCKKD